MAAFMRDEGVLAGLDATPEQRKAAEAIDAACRGSGFIYLTDFGLSESLRDRAFAASEELFGLSENTKLGSLRRLSANSNFGYGPLGLEGLNRRRAADLKEVFNVRKECFHTDVFAGCTDGFEHTAKELWDVLEEAACWFSTACALALGVEETFFSCSMARHDQSTLRFLHYPPCSIPAVDNNTPGGSYCSQSAAPAIRCGEHTDFGIFTFLVLAPGAPEGLQVKPVQGGEVRGVPDELGGDWSHVVVPQDGSVGAVVNTGALLARWTNDHWRATAHRVVVPDAVAAAAHRYSIAAFFHPDAGALVEVHPDFVPIGERPRYPPIIGREFLSMKLKEARGGA